MVFETRKSIAWMEHGLQISLKIFALSMEDKMVAGAFGRARNYGWGDPLIITSHEALLLCALWIMGAPSLLERLKDICKSTFLIRDRHLSFPSILRRLFKIWRTEYNGCRIFRRMSLRRGDNWWESLRHLSTRGKGEGNWTNLCSLDMNPFTAMFLCPNET